MEVLTDVQGVKTEDPYWKGADGVDGADDEEEQEEGAKRRRSQDKRRWGRRIRLENLAPPRGSYWNAWIQMPVAVVDDDDDDDAAVVVVGDVDGGADEDGQAVTTGWNRRWRRTRWTRTKRTWSSRSTMTMRSSSKRWGEVPDKPGAVVVNAVVVGVELTKDEIHAAVIVIGSAEAAVPSVVEEVRVC